MTVRIVTDSACDLPTSALEEFEISMVPANVVYQGRAYKDRVDISQDELFRLLEDGTEVPTTAAPPPAYFTEVYERLAEETDEIVSLHATSEHSALYDSALRGSENVSKPCRIEVVDTRLLSMGQGILAMDAAEAARRGASLDEVVGLVKREIPLLRLYAAFDTMRYLMLGGRVNGVIGAIRAIGTTLRVKLLLTMRDGRLRPAGVARTYPRAIDRLVSLMGKLVELEEWSVVYSTERGQAEAVAERLAGICPAGRVPVARLGPALGVHGGPGAILTVAKVRGT